MRFFIMLNIIRKADKTLGKETIFYSVSEPERHMVGVLIRRAQYKEIEKAKKTEIGGEEAALILIVVAVTRKVTEGPKFRQVLIQHILG